MEDVKFKYLRNEVGMLVRYDPTRSVKSVVFNPFANKFMTNDKSIAANVSSACNFAKEISEEEFNRITSNASNKS